MAYANGGLPLLLVIDVVAFAYGGIVVLLIEGLIYFRLGKLPLKDAFALALFVNFVSTLTVGVLFPFAIALIFGIVGTLVGGTIGSTLISVGTWVIGRDDPEGKVSMAYTYFWLGVAFLLTVVQEDRLLATAWKSEAAEPVISITALSWCANAASYIALAAIIFLGLTPIYP